MPFGTIRFMENSKLIYHEACYAIRGAIFKVYRELGNGFREEVYQQCLGLLANFGSYPKASVEHWAG